MRDDLDWEFWSVPCTGGLIWEVAGTRGVYQTNRVWLHFFFFLVSCLYFLCLILKTNYKNKNTIFFFFFFFFYIKMRERGQSILLISQTQRVDRQHRNLRTTVFRSNDSRETFFCPSTVVFLLKIIFFIKK